MDFAFEFPADSDDCLVVWTEVGADPLDLRRDLFLYADTIDRGRGLTPGALQLAAAVLCVVTDRVTAAKLHRRFAAAVIANAPDSMEPWKLPGDQVRDWLSGQIPAAPAESRLTMANH